MATEPWAIGLAATIQSALGTANIDAQWAAGPVAAIDGSILGDRESGDANSGIVVPTFARLSRARADVAASTTKQPSSFLGNDPQTLSVSFLMQGNGATSTPATDEAKPDAGIDAILEGAGLIGQSGTDPLYEYTPRHKASTGGSIKYLTLGLWIGDLRWYLQDCVVERLSFVPAPGGAVLVTADIRIASVNAQAGSITIPTFTYGNQATLSAPRVVGAPVTWGTARGFGAFSVTLSNPVVKTPDSEVAETGQRLGFGERTVSVAGAVYVDAADTDFEYTELIRATGTPADASYQIGTIAGGTDTINAFLVEVFDLEVETYKPVQLDTALGIEFTGHGTGSAVGGEFKLTLN